jgi:hypothetical protein
MSVPQASARQGDETFDWKRHEGESRHMPRKKVRRTRDKHRLPPEVRTTKVEEVIGEFADGCRKLLSDAFRKLAADGKPASGASDEYREVPGLPGYRVSASGQVQSCWGSTGMSAPEEWYTIQPHLAEGWRCVRLGKRRERADCRVGRLVLLAWV